MSQQPMQPEQRQVYTQLLNDELKTLESIRSAIDSLIISKQKLRNENRK